MAHFTAEFSDFLFSFFFSCDYAVEPEVLDLRTPNCSLGPGSDWGKKEKKGRRGRI